MSAPKGFGRNYFSLTAILAYTTAVTLQAQEAQATHHTLQHYEEHEPLDDPPDETLCLQECLKEPDPHGGGLYNLYFFYLFKIFLGGAPPKWHRSLKKF